MIKPVSFLIGIPAAFALANAASISDFKISTFGKLSNLNGNDDCCTLPSSSPQFVLIPAK